MISFDVKSHFTNMPLTQMLNLCVEALYRNQTHVGNLTKSLFYNLFKIITLESFFVFDVKFYENYDSVVVGSPLWPRLANVFMCQQSKHHVWKVINIPINNIKT